MTGGEDEAATGGGDEAATGGGNGDDEADGDGDAQPRRAAWRKTCPAATGSVDGRTAPAAADAGRMGRPQQAASTGGVRTDGSATSEDEAGTAGSGTGGPRTRPAADP